jgi:hypothetical protein
MNELSFAFKTDQIFRNFATVSLHKNMQDFLIWFRKTFGEPFITSAFREGDTGVHGTIPLRGLDIRFYIYTNPQNVVDTINVIWIYDFKRPEMKCAILHDTGKGKHIHLQVHPNTRKI